MNQKGDNSMPEGDFVKFYLGEEGQGSNVYYASARAVVARQEALPGQTAYKSGWPKIAVALAAVALFLILGGTFFVNYQKNIRPAGGSEAALKKGYEEISSAQKSLAEFRFQEAFFSLNEAHRSLSQGRGDVSYFSALALGLSDYWPFNYFADGAGAVSDSENELAQAGLSAADSFGAFLKVVQARDIASLPAALEEVKNTLDNLKTAKNKTGDAPKMDELIERFDRLIPRLDLAVWAAGIDRPRTFLVVVQNTNQVRATGGAIVSAGAFSVDSGQISKISFDDVYNIDGQLATKVIPPKPVQKMDTLWSLHNANWFLDFPTSARKIAYFYQKSQDVRPDGVIVLNEKALEKLLEMTGPVELLKYDLTIDKNNFGHLAAFNILDEKKANQAKRVFNDFTSALLGNIFSTSENKLTGLFDLIKESAERKDALVWLGAEKRESVVSELGWGGEMFPADGADYLAVVASNMDSSSNGLKAEQNIAKETEILENGEIINTVRAERKYSGNDLPDKSSSGLVSEYWRFYVPAGSELLSVSGFSPSVVAPAADYSTGEFKTDDDVAFSESGARVDSDRGVETFKESGKKVYGGWVKVSSEYPTLVTVKYKLPASLGAPDKINFVFQKQPGVESGLDFKMRRAGALEQETIYSGDFSKDMYFKSDK